MIAHIWYAIIGLLTYIWLKLDTMNTETPQSVKKWELFMIFLNKDLFKLLMAVTSIPVQIGGVQLLASAKEETLVFDWLRQFRTTIVYAQDMFYPLFTFFSSYIILKGKTKAEKFIDEKLQ